MIVGLVIFATAAESTTFDKIRKTTYLFGKNENQIPTTRGEAFLKDNCVGGRVKACCIVIYQTYVK